MRRNDDFFTWATNNVPYWEQLTKEELVNLKKLHGEVKNHRGIWNRTYDSAIHSTSGVDYTTSIGKAEERLDTALKTLETYVAELNKKYRVTPSQEISVTHTK